MIKVKLKSRNAGFLKTATGMREMDFITNGGIPKNHSTLSTLLLLKHGWLYKDYYRSS